MRRLRLACLFLVLAVAPGCVVAGSPRAYAHGYDDRYAPRSYYVPSPHYAPRPNYAPRYYGPPSRFAGPPRPYWAPPAYGRRGPPTPFWAERPNSPRW